MTQLTWGKPKGATALLGIGPLLFLLGCETRVVGGLEERDANGAIARLAERGIAAAKATDPDSEGRFTLSVGRAEAAAAVALLAAEGLPPRRAPGVLEALGGGSIIPSRAAEHARWVVGTSGELERSLSAVEGVISARVHLAVPIATPLTTQDEPQAQATASVLLSYRASPELSVAQIQQLVAGAVPGLSSSAVTVVMRKIPRGTAEAPLEWVRVGPVTVTRASALTLKAILGSALGLNLILLSALLWLWQRSKKQRFGASTEPGSGVPTPG